MDSDQGDSKCGDKFTSRRIILDKLIKNDTIQCIIFSFLCFCSFGGDCVVSLRCAILLLHVWMRFSMQYPREF